MGCYTEYGLYKIRVQPSALQGSTWSWCFGTNIGVIALFWRSNNFKYRRTGRLREVGGGWALNNLLKKFSQFSECSRNSRKETRVIRCTNIGLHMKWKYSYIWTWIYHMGSWNTLKENSICHFDGGRYHWDDLCHCWLQSRHMSFQY